MKITVLADGEGRLIGIAPVHEPHSPATGQGPQLVGRMVAQEGQRLHELEVDDQFLDDQKQIAGLHQTHRVRDGKLEQYKA